MPDVPQHYAQVPPVPQRQGWFLFFLSFDSFCDVMAYLVNTNQEVLLIPKLYQLFCVSSGVGV